MAFDQPLEADRVDDNFLISLVRGPVLGALSWIMGGEDADDSERELRRGLEDMIIDDEAEEERVNHNDNGYHHHLANDKQQQQQPKANLPRMVHSDVSVSEIAGTTMDHNNMMMIKNHNYHLPRSEKKKMSWSDNLVEYMDEESVRHEPGTAAGSSSGIAKPIKSAMTRTASIRSHSLAGGSSSASSSSSSAEEKERKIRYLPSGLDRAHNGLIMPTRPVGNDNNGIDSPQWGWYALNTTPPTPEMYHSRSSLRQSQKTTMSAASSSEGDNPAIRGPNRVFQGLKAGSNRPPVGWPSVPL
ncbi:expressed unknown protein [Seminavis robusta]|uniref:Uncharacterized protein n=1 Tax=Seminavis robusta TaxID=568900 RepID=A0A9N8DY65_9STRA|nr:expressed unknown protein [Seminavis robusta]|eukprot:Sro371_g128560.1 n/a (300) ;mRNA; r:23623-25184